MTVTRLERAFIADVPDDWFVADPDTAKEPVCLRRAEQFEDAKYPSKKIAVTESKIIL